MASDKPLVLLTGGTGRLGGRLLPLRRFSGHRLLLLNGLRQFLGIEFALLLDARLSDSGAAVVQTRDKPLLEPDHSINHESHSKHPKPGSDSDRR